MLKIDESQDIRSIMHAMYIKLKLTNIPDLTEVQKALLEKAQKFIEKDIKNKCDNAIKRLGLPIDTPQEVIMKILVEESRNELEESRRKCKEIEKRNKEFNRQIRDANRQIREKEKKFKEEKEKERKELLKKDAEEWKEWRAKHPYFNPLVFREENKELPPCPKNCDRPPWFRRNKNKLLDMRTG